MRRYIYFYIQIPSSAFGNSFTHARHANHLAVANSCRNSDRNFFFTAHDALAFTLFTIFFWHFPSTQTCFTKFCTRNGTEEGPLHFMNLTPSVAVFAGFHLGTLLSARTFTSQTLRSFCN